MRDLLRNKLLENSKRPPALASIEIGEDPDAGVYIRNKEKACLEVGILSRHIALPIDATESQVIDTIEHLNKDESLDGIILQMPIPTHLSYYNIVSKIAIDKDVDCMNPMNMGLLFMGHSNFVPNTPLSVMTMLEEYQIPLEGKKVVVIGRSNIVGKPVSILLMGKNATVTIAHSKTENLPQVAKEADIVVAAIGKAEMIDASYIKEGAVVIDVGINYSEGKIKGDVKQADILGISSHLTPVPGGIGSLTTTLLLENTYKAFCRHI